MKCEWCSKDFTSSSPRQRFCSESCKQKNKRNQKTEDKEAPGSPGWYNHGTVDNPNQTWDRACVLCGKSFTTSLMLMRFCSEECKADIMVVIANGPHKNFHL